MKTLMKIALTYAAISMTSGFLYGFIWGKMLGNMLTINMGLFMFLWLGPMCLAISIGVPIALWQLWLRNV